MKSTFMKSLIDFKANKLEYKPSFLTSMKEAFIPRTEFNEDRRLDQQLKRIFSLGTIDEFKIQHPQKCSIFKDVDINQQENSRIAKSNRKMILQEDNGVVRMDRNLEPINKASVHNKFFKPKDKIVVRMSFQDFLKANKLNKEMKADLLDTHYKLGETDEQINSTHRQFLAHKPEQLLHHLYEENKDELLQDYYKRRNETQNFTIKDDIVTESFGPNEVLKLRPIMTPNIKSSKKLDEFKPMTNIEFTKTNFKLGYKDDFMTKSMSDLKLKKF